jgi:dTDP-4-dehydrorhamnose reductase
MRVLVLGAGGQLGSELRDACAALGDSVIALTHTDCDLAQSGQAREAIFAHRPEIVFNAAAYTKVDDAESEQKLALQVNATAVGEIGEAARAIGARVVHYSTDYIFDGNARDPIPEDAAPNPVNAYGRTKLAGEEALRDSGAPAYIVRTAWVYGRGHNFVRTVLRVTRERGVMRVVDDQRGAPTWARDLASASRRLTDVGEPGIYHLTNGGDCTWFEVALKVVELAGIEAPIEPISSAEYPTPARRPSYSVLANNCWIGLGEPPLRPWTEALAMSLPEIAGVGA